MAKSDEIKAQLEKMAAGADKIAEAQSMLSGLPTPTIKIKMSPLPMLNGRYGLIGTGTVDIHGIEVPVTVTATVPSLKMGLSPLNVAFAQLARDRRDNLRDANAAATAPETAEKALDRMSKDEREAFLVKYLETYIKARSKSGKGKADDGEDEDD